MVNGYYGIRKASQGFYNKDPKDLTDYEATFLAGLPNAPSILSSEKNSELAKQRHKIVLDSMVKYNKLTQEEADKIYENR